MIMQKAGVLEKDFLKKHDIYISTVSDWGNEKIEKVTFADEYGNVNIYIFAVFEDCTV